MAAGNDVPLERKFSVVTRDQESKFIEAGLEFWYRTKPRSWNELESEFRVVIIAAAGVGKTHEMHSRAKHVAESGRPAFFIRIEDIDNDFQDEFEIGNSDQFNRWLHSTEEAWFYLDSVDEARLTNPRDFKKAIQRFARKIGDACHRAHIYISSRPYAWQPSSDRLLIEEYLPLNSSQNGSAHSNELQICALEPLEIDDIRKYSEYRNVNNAETLIREIRRADLISIASRPFDLDLIIRKWNTEGKLDGKLALLEFSIHTRLKEIDPTRKQQQPLETIKAISGAQTLAAAVTLTGQSGIIIPDQPANQSGLDPESILREGWDAKTLQFLLERGIFDDAIYGAVRFRHREIRELLTAQWFCELLKRDQSRWKIESLFFAEQYGQSVIRPRLRHILHWLILFDEPIRQKAVAIQPEIALEGGDPSELPLLDRKAILHNLIQRIIHNKDNQQNIDLATKNIFSRSDLADDIRELLLLHCENQRVMFFLGYIVWQGKISSCLDLLHATIVNTTFELTSRIVAIRAVMENGTREQILKTWNSINTQKSVHPDILSEIIIFAKPEKDFVALTVQTLKILSHCDELADRGNGLPTDMMVFINRLADTNDRQPILLSEITIGFIHLIKCKPHMEEEYGAVSKKFLWLYGVALFAAKHLLKVKSPDCFNENLQWLLTVNVSLPHYPSDITETKKALQEYISNWTELNDTLFWTCVEQRRAEREAKGKTLDCLWLLEYPRPYWDFQPDRFYEVVELLALKNNLSDQLILVDLAFELFIQAGMPADWHDQLKLTVENDPSLLARFNCLESNADNKSRLEREREYEELRAVEERNTQEAEKSQARALMIENIRKNFILIEKQPDIELGSYTRLQRYLFDEIKEEQKNASSTNNSWQLLLQEYGEQVAQAFRRAAMTHWRHYTPGLGSEGANIKAWSGSTEFALLGLDIESAEQPEFPSELTDYEVKHALRYIVHCEYCPNWLEMLFNVYPNSVIDAVWIELKWEFDKCPMDTSLFYIMRKIVRRAAWMNNRLGVLIIAELKKKSPKNTELLRDALCLLIESDVSKIEIVNLAKSKVNKKTPLFELSIWYSIWIACEPKTGIASIRSRLKGYNGDEAILLVQHFISELSCPFRGQLHEALNHQELFISGCHLKELIQLIYTYIPTSEDILSSHRPTFKDDVASSKSRLINLLANIPGESTFSALNNLSITCPDEKIRPLLTHLARKRAEDDADLQLWDYEHFSTFTEAFYITPRTHRQLFDLGVSVLIDIKNWLEKGNNSLAGTYLRANDETEMRKIMAREINLKISGRFTCAEENPLANDQRPDIFLQHPDVHPPVPIELKLLDKDWSGPELCERLENQLVGDYLREATCGIFLVVGQEKSSDKKWLILGKRVGINELQGALSEYWASIRNKYPLVEAVKVISIDLTFRRVVSES